MILNFCAERPSGYIENLDTSSGKHCESVPEQVMNCYPIDVVNYFIAFEENFIAIHDREASMYYITNIYPIPHELDNSIKDGRLSCNYMIILQLNINILLFHSATLLL